jgi:Calreticulin family
MIEDAAAVKPAGWMDDAAFEIPDPEALKPEDWDDEEVRSQTVCVRVCLCDMSAVVLGARNVGVEWGG